MSLEEVDGGVGYYGRFAYGLPTAPSFFPIGVWGAYDQTLANIARDKAVGLNLYVWPADSTIPISRFEQNGMHTLLSSDWYGKPGVATSPANNGYMLNDEVDMEYQRNVAGGYAVMQNAVNAAPKDGRALYTNYGKCVAIWDWCSDANMGRYVNDFVQLVSDDVYWFTDPYESPPRLHRASSYGLTVDRLRFLDGLDGQRKPIWNFVEVGHPFESSAGDGTARAITPPEIRAAVWHSIIAGARGIIYFQHSFGGPCLSHHALRTTGSCYAGVQSMVTSVNQQIKDLAPVLNAPTVASGTSTNPTIRALVKWHAGHFYVFAGSKENQSSTGTVSIPCVGDATAARLGESGSLPVTGGSFSDQFPDGNAIHIYRIDGGSTCGLLAGVEQPATGGGGADPRQPLTARVGRLPRRVSLRSGRLPVPVTCAAPCTVHSRLMKRGASRRVRLATARRRFDAGRHKLVLRLSKRARRYVARARKPLSVRLDTVIIEPGGAGARRTQRLVAWRR